MYLFCDEAQFTQDGITNCHNTHVWFSQQSAPFHPKQLPTQLFCECVVQLYQRPTNWDITSWGMLAADYYLDFLQDELSLLKGIPLKAWLNMWLQHNGTSPHFGLQVRTWIGAIEIVGLVAEDCISGHLICQTWHPLISACGATWRTWCIGEIADTRLTLKGTSWMMLLSYRSVMKAYRKQHVLF
jgi:hypothetical protein